MSITVTSIKQNLLATAVFLIVLFAMPLAHAHHSTVANPALYEADNLIEFKAEIVKVIWRNPHVRIRVEMAEGPDKGKEWELEMGATGIMALSRAGIERDFVKAGEIVTVAGYRSRWGRSKNSLGLLHLLLPSGEEYVDTRRKARWVAESQTLRTLGNQRAPDEKTEEGAKKIAAARASAKGIFRVYGTNPIRKGPPHPRPETYTHLLTEWARARAAEYNVPTDNPELRCEQGMPITMFDPVPMEIVDKGDRILINVEEHDIQRVVHLNASAGDASKAPVSALGYSTGRWQGDTLVVTTSRIKWPYFDPYGTPQSDQAHYVETFSWAENDERLNYTFTAIDPQVFTEPVIIEWPRAWSPGTELQEFNCTY